MSRRLHRAYRITDVFLGIGYLVMAGLLVVGALLAYNQAFEETVDVTLEAGTVGNALQKGSDVKVNGVPVGRVTDIEATDSGAELSLSLDPDAAAKLPSGTVARLLPKTLFGERYVSLVSADQPGGSGAAVSAGPSGPTGKGLSDGDTIHQDSSQEAAELQQVFDQLLPVLKTLQPQKLSATLGELSLMLDGQGEAIGDTMTHWASYLEKLTPLVPTMTADLQKLADVAVNYEDVLPDVIDALDTMTITSHTLVDQRTKLTDVYANVITGADTTDDWVGENKNTIEILSTKSRKALDAVAPYATQFPCMFRAINEFIPVMDKTLGKGTDEPGIHVRLNVVKARGKYLPGRDKPTFKSNGKVRCPYVPSSHRRPGEPSSDGMVGASAHEPRSIAAPPNRMLETRIKESDGAGLGDANSPGENQLIAELVAPTQGMAPDAYPDWGSLLVGPALRNTKVVLR